MKLTACNFISFVESQADATSVGQQNDAIRAALVGVPPHGCLIAENAPFQIHPHHLTADGRQYSLRRESSKRTVIFRTK